MEISKLYHFIGIGGVSMSALALIMLKEGYHIQGSDSSINEFTETLKNNGIKVFIGHKDTNLSNADIIVYSSAISNDNEELVYAKALHKKIMTRAELLQELSFEYENVIAISGAHGKTTVTGMITEVFMLAGLKPTAHIGGVVKSLRANFALGDKKYFITEACEYKDNFLLLKPKIGVILNVEAEHLDYFKTYDNVVKAFNNFSSNCENLVKYEKVPVKRENAILYGKCGYNARKIKQIKNGKYAFDCYFDDKKLFHVVLNIVGKHNIYNALATIAVSRFFKISDKIILKAIRNFSGITRRYDIISEAPFVVHDYAHHPSQVVSVLEATRNFKKGKLIVIFQPHTYTRTQSLMSEFLNAFDVADEICIIKTYAAREKYLAAGSARKLYFNLKKKIHNIRYFATFEDCYENIIGRLKKSDTVLILGAGDIEKLAYNFKW